MEKPKAIKRIDNSLLARLERHQKETPATGLIQEAMDEIKELRRRLGVIELFAKPRVET